MIFHARRISFFTLALASLALLCTSFPLHSYASSASGWFHPVVESVGLTSACGPDGALVDVRLAEHSFYTPANPAGVSLRLRVVDKVTGALVGDTGTVIGNEISGALCFNPTAHAILPTVGDSTTYHKAGGVALSFRPSPSLSLVRGNHIRGYVHLLRHTVDDLPNISHVSPGVQSDEVNINTNRPTFRIWNHMITPTYEITSATTTSVYVRNRTNGELTRIGDFPTPRATGQSDMPTPAERSLGDGVYDWFYHQELNGVSRVEVSNTPVDFVGFPVSSLSDRVQFRVDTTDPSIWDLILNHEETRVDDTTVETRMRASLSDTGGSGIRSIYMRITDSLGNVLAERTINDVPNTSTQHRVIPFPPESKVTLVAGETYTLFVRATDDAGNVTERSASRTVALPPLVSLVTPHDDVSLNTKRLKAQVTAAGSSPIINRWLCYGTVNNDTIVSQAPPYCEWYDGGNVGDVFSREVTLPAGVYYYQARVENAEGLFANSNRVSFVIGVVSCTLGTRCVGVDSQIRVCHTINPLATGYELSYCEGSDPCPDPTLRIIIPYATNDFWHPNPGSHTYGQRYHYYVRALYASGWSEWTYLFGQNARDCSPVLTAPSITGQTWTNLQPSGVDEFEVMLGANVTSDGGSPITWRGTCWGLVPLSSSIDQCVPTTGGTGVFSHLRTGLPANTRIYFQGRAVNAIGVARTAIGSFVPGAVAPTLVDLFTWDVGINSASIRATIVDDGGAPITYRNVRFCKGEGCNLWSGFHTCGSNDTSWVNVPPQIDFVRQCTGSNYGPVLVPTYFRYAVCAVNLNNLPRCLTGYFIVDPDNITSEGGGAGTFLPQ